MSLELLAIDLGKRSFHCYGIDSDGVIISRKTSRFKLLETINELAPETIAMEACASAHFWGRRFLADGHRVLLINPRFVKPFVKGSKNDAADAEGIYEAALLLPIVIIGLVYVPYVARPVRGQVLALRNSEFVLASVGLGIPTWRILVRDMLPNVSTTLIVYIPLMMALNITTESALSFLSVGVQPPDASGGTIILDGQRLLYTRPAVSLAPGLAIVITVLALNLLGDGVRDALDPRARLQR
jgi:hypothetical protein